MAGGTKGADDDTVGHVMAWTIILGAYLLLGVLSAVVGPAARMRQHEELKNRTSNIEVPFWKLFVFSISIVIGTILHWPVLVPSAWNAEREQRNGIIGAMEPYGGESDELIHPRFKLVMSQGDKSLTVDECIAMLPTEGNLTLTFSELHKLMRRVEWEHWDELMNRLDTLGFRVEEPGGDENRKCALSVRVARELGQPIILVSQVKNANRESRFSDRMPGDQVWKFSTSSDSWEHLAGRSGLGLLRGGVVIDTLIEIMN